jgi:flagellar biosynthesis protein FlhF
MEPRTFRAPNTQSALEMIQQELGAEAIIVSVREIPAGPAWQTWKKPEVEVLAIAGQNNTPEASNGFSPTTSLSNSDQDIPLSPRSPRDYGRMKNVPKAVTREEIETALAHLVGPRTLTALRKAETLGFEPRELQAHLPENRKEQLESIVPAALIAIRKQLIDQGVDKQLVSKLISACGSTQSQTALEDAARVSNHIKHQIEAYIRVMKTDAAIYATKQEKMVVCMIGLSGSGKTSALGKLAAYYMKTLGKRVAWISADTVRTGAISLAQTYTQSMNIPLYLAYTPQDLEKAIQDEKEAEIILLDTSARSPYQENDIVELGAFLTTLPKKVVYMTAPATIKEKDLHEAWVAYSPLDIAGLVITKIDETKYFGDILNLAWHTQAPLAYFTFGTQILDNLLSVDAMKCAGLVLGERITQ